MFLVLAMYSAIKICHQLFVSYSIYSFSLKQILLLLAYISMQMVAVHNSGDFHLIPEAGVIEPLQQLLAHFHWAGKKGPICQQEVFYKCWVYYRVLFHQMHC